MNFQKKLEISEQSHFLHLQRGFIFHGQHRTYNYKTKSNQSIQMSDAMFFAFLKKKKVSAKLVSVSCL